MKQRFLSIFTVVALMASVLAGAMGVSVSYVKADSMSADDPGYFDSIISTIRSYNYFSDTDLDNFVAFVRPKVADLEENENYLVCAICEPENNNYAISVYMKPAGSIWLTEGQLSGRLGITSTSVAYNSYCIAALRYSQYFSASNFIQYQQNLVTAATFRRGGSYNWSVTNSNDKYFSFPTTLDFEISGRLCYSSKVVNAGTFNYGNSFSYIQNLFTSDPGPQYDEINLVTFNVGIKRFLTVDDQDYVQGMDPEKEEYSWAIFGLDKEGNDYDIVLKDIDLVVVPNADFYTDELFNLATYGALCWQLPDELDVIVSSGFGVRNILGQIDSLVAVCVNCPYWINEELPTEEQLQDEQYMQAFNTFNTYVESYNTTHVIPESLAETLFGTNGSKLYPVTISEPTNIANTASGSDVVTTQGLHTFKWSMVEPDHLGYNYELFDTVIVPSSLLGSYGLVYFYDDTLQKPFQFIDVVSFGTLLEEFDCIIIVPDDRNTLEENTWWSNLLPSGLSGFDDMAVSGSSSLGIEYVDDAAIGNNYQGFVIVTKRAIQKQQLFVFNDGITKTYKLMSDYIEKRGNWEDSFLTWTASLFSQWQSLDGKLGNIYNLLYGWNLSSVLSDISESLARIANNTSEEDPGYWFLSLFNWLNRFSVTDSDFANWVSEYDNFTDDLPDPGSGATVIPFPTAIPTVAVGG